MLFERDEHPRTSSLEALAKLKPVVKPDGTVTAGNASGLNDGAAAMLVASDVGAARHGLTPRARVLAMASAGVAPRIMGVGPIEAARRRHRSGTSAGYVRSAANDVGCRTTAANWRPLCNGIHVYRRRAGYRPDHRTRLICVSGSVKPSAPTGTLGRVR